MPAIYRNCLELKYCLHWELWGSWGSWASIGLIITSEVKKDSTITNIFQSPSAMSAMASLFHHPEQPVSSSPPTQLVVALGEALTILEPQEII